MSRETTISIFHEIENHGSLTYESKSISKTFKVFFKFSIRYSDKFWYIPDWYNLDSSIQCNPLLILSLTIRSIPGTKKIVQ